jgi:nicotinamide riboside transporter PnuC
MHRINHNEKNSGAMARTLIYLANLVLIAVIVQRVIAIDNDKAHLIFLFYYPALLLLNFLIGVVLKIAKRKRYRDFWQLCIWMGCLFIPILMILISL